MRAPLAASHWFTCPRRDLTAPLRLWCLPFAGAGAAVWHPWSKALAGTAEITAVRPPGRENRFKEAPFVSLALFVAALVEQMVPYLHEAYALCGHSLGGLAVFELSRALRARGLPAPVALVVLGVRAPHHPPDEPLLHRLPPAQFVAEVERRYGEVPREIREHPDFLELLLPVLRADLEMFETYSHTPATPLDLPVLALGGAGDRIVTRAQLVDWRTHTTADFEADLVPGGHFFPQENLAATTDRVRAFLARRLRPSVRNLGNGASPDLNTPSAAA